MRIRVYRAPRPVARADHRVAFVVAMTVLGLALSAIPAAADTSGSNTSTVQVAPPAVRAVTVNTNAAQSTLDQCSGGSTSTLVIPGGHCGKDGLVTITNGPVAGHINVNGASAAPQDGGIGWSLAPTGGASIISTPSPAGFLGTNMYAEQNASSTQPGIWIGNNPACDLAFTAAAPIGSCAAAAGQSTTEGLGVYAPTATTDSSSSFTITTTWTAVP